MFGINILIVYGQPIDFIGHYGYRILSFSCYWFFIISISIVKINLRMRRYIVIYWVLKSIYLLGIHSRHVLELSKLRIFELCVFIVCRLQRIIRIDVLISSEYITLLIIFYCILIKVILSLVL